MTVTVKEETAKTFNDRIQTQVKEGKTGKCANP